MTKYQDLMASLRKGNIFPLYLFYGEEEFLIQEAVGLIVNSVVDPGARDFNFNTMYGRDSTASELVNLCQTLPFMSEKRLVIVKDIDAYKAGDLEELVRYLKDPSPSTCLVMISHQGKYDKKAVVSAVEASGAVTRFFPLLEREIISWIDEQVKSRGMSVQRDAAQFLFQILGNDLQKIGNELEKIQIFLKGEKNISYETARTVAGDFREYTSFDLADAVGSKNGERALVILSRLLQEGEAPVGLLGSITWNFRRLMVAKSMEAAGMGPGDIVRSLRVIFHQANLFKEQMRKYTLNELKEVFTILLSTDKALKSGGLNGKLVLERMILRLCG